jgi:hypothetical protein
MRYTLRTHTDFQRYRGQRLRYSAGILAQFTLLISSAVWGPRDLLANP